MAKPSRGVRNANWIERYCIVPSGPTKGQHVRLTQAQRSSVIAIYDGGDAAPVAAPLSAYLALLCICGPEALINGGAVPYDSDLFTLWNATGPDLKEVLKFDAGRIVCPELGTRYPPKAAA